MPSSTQYYAKAHTNIALIKYWGKRDDNLFLPFNDSLSLTLDAFYTETIVSLDSELKADIFYINDKAVSASDQLKLKRFMARVRKDSHLKAYAEVRSYNHVPTGAGFASSASAYAALATAASFAYGLSMAPVDLSRLARQGSGSASRSIYGGVVRWHKGRLDDGTDSYATQIYSQREAQDLGIQLISVSVDENKKEISSSEGMSLTVKTSPFYNAWLQSVDEDLNEIEKAFETKEFAKIGQVAERNALKMHATMMTSDPSIVYWNAGTIEVMQAVRSLRQKGIEVYFTIDAGPNVKLLCLERDVQSIMEVMSSLNGVTKLTLCKVGEGITYKIINQEE